MKFIKIWFLPLFLSICLFLTLRPAFVKAVLPDASASVLTEVGSEIGANKVMQIYYIKDGNRIYITESPYANESPDYSGDYITWVGQSINGTWQIFLYNVISGITTQITSSGNNQNPKVSDKGEVVWEAWVSDSWQIFNFDGIKVTQLTSGEPSFNPDIEGDYITYARKDITGTWRSVVYSISKGKTADISAGISSKYPKMKNGKIILGDSGSEREFNLTVEDLFVLELAPLTSTDSANFTVPAITESVNFKAYESDESRINESTESAGTESIMSEPETVTEEEILEELNATESGSGE